MILRVLLSALFGLLFWFQVLAAEKDDQAECLLISDIHFNPFLTPGLFAALAKHPASEWARLLDSTLPDGVSQYGSDSNYPLLKSGLAAAAKAIPHPEFMDDFRVIEAEWTGLVVNKLVPSISPTFKNNPGFQVYQYDRASGAVRNYRTYYLSNVSTAGKATEFEQAKWELEYDFREAYQQPALDISAIVSIARFLKASIQGVYRDYIR